MNGAVLRTGLAVSIVLLQFHADGLLCDIESQVAGAQPIPAAEPPPARR